LFTRVIAWKTKLLESTAHATWSLEIRFKVDEAAIGCAGSEKNERDSGMAFTIVQSERRGAAANRLQDHHPARGGRRGMVETRSKSRPVKDRLTASGRGGEGLRGSRRSKMLCVSAKISEPSFHGVTIDPVKCS
jgi:hypothetical protein